MKIPVIDLHADTYMKKVAIKKIHYMEKLYKKIENEEKFIKIDSDFDITEDFLKKGGVKIQTQSLFINDVFILNPLHTALNILKIIKDDIKKYNWFQVKTSKNIKENLNNNKIGILISIEGLEVIENDLELLDIFQELGVRIVAPTWNRALPYFSSIKEKCGILSRGKELIEKMIELKLILDVSHMSEKSFFDVVDFNVPFIASHSNCKSVNSHKRNLTDEQIKILQEHQGVMGINFNPPFLKPDNYDTFLKRFNIKKNHKYPEGFYWIYNMIDYVGNKFSLDILAFGSDFDGIASHPEGVENTSFYQKFALFLKEMGLNKNEIENLFYKNVLRIFKKLL